MRFTVLTFLITLGCAFVTSAIPISRLDPRSFNARWDFESNHPESQWLPKKQRDDEQRPNFKNDPRALPDMPLALTAPPSSNASPQISAIIPGMVIFCLFLGCFFFLRNVPGQFRAARARHKLTRQTLVPRPSPEILRRIKTAPATLQELTLPCPAFLPPTSADPDLELGIPHPCHSASASAPDLQMRPPSPAKKPRL